MSRNGCPTHVGIIMDGNGRWAAQRGLPRSAGHKKGADAMEKLIIYAEKNTDIRYLTFYAFSTENWSRPKDEVDNLMKLFESYMDKLITTAEKHDIVIKFIGSRERLAPSLVEKMKQCEIKSAGGKKLTVFVAVNYGGMQEITEAAKSVAKDLAGGNIKESDITADLIASRLYTADAPAADLIIRPSGEYRLSNFLTWQSAYAEFYFDTVLWPDYTGEDLERALDEFEKRNRRFGGI